MAARNGSIPLTVTVQSVENRKSGVSRLVATVGQYTVTIEKIGKLPDDVNPRPDDTLDLVIGYDPRP